MIVIGPYIAEGEAEGPIPSLVGSAYGRILELGPGSGSQITRFDKSKVEKIYGVEPVEALHNALRARVKEASLESAYEIVPCGIQDYDVLAKNGITEGSLDCIVSVQVRASWPLSTSAGVDVLNIVVVTVLCSVPNPEESVKVLWKLLKPGGKLIVFEHGRNNDAVTRIIQYMYDPVWSFLIGDCHLTRPIRNTLVNAGEWKGIELREDPEEDAETCCLPRVCGTLTKEGSA
ncbi:hypothetical protein MMC25_000624 [Agyrium rufum]|nr:hypothetical protein [Agyrium rufum]